MKNKLLVSKLLTNRFTKFNYSIGSLKDFAMEFFPKKLMNIATFLLVNYSPKQDRSLGKNGWKNKL